jgi:hypothetical protein
MVSDHSLESKWCKRELGMAITNQLRGGLISVLPVRVGDVVMPPAAYPFSYQRRMPTVLVHPRIGA